MSETVPTLAPAGTDMTPATTATATTTLQPLEKLTPRQKEISGKSATSNDKAAAATAAAITTAATTATVNATKKKRPSSLSVKKFDPESAVNYKSPFMFGTPKATTTPKGSRKSFVSYQKVQQVKQAEIGTIVEDDTEVDAEGGKKLPITPGSPPPNQGVLFYEGSKWFWRYNHNIHVQIYDALPCYVARCNVLEEEIEYPPIYISKEAVEESLDQSFIVHGNSDLDQVRRSFNSKEDLTKTAEKKAEETKKRYMEQVAAVILEKLLMKKDEDGQEKLFMADSKNGTPLLLPMTPKNLKLPSHEFRVQRKMSVSEFRRISEAFKDDLQKARDTVAKAGDRSDDTTNLVNVLS